MTDWSPSTSAREVEDTFITRAGRIFHVHSHADTLRAYHRKTDLHLAKSIRYCIANYLLQEFTYSIPRCYCTSVFNFRSLSVDVSEIKVKYHNVIRFPLNHSRDIAGFR